MKQNDKDKCDETTKETIYRFDKKMKRCAKCTSMTC